MDRLKKIIDGAAVITDDEWAMVKDHFTITEVPKNSFFIREGKINTRSGFILEGVMRYFTFDKDGSEPTCYFTFEDHYIVDPYAYSEQKISGINLKSVTDCTLAVISFHEEKKLKDLFPRWSEITTALLLKVAMEFANQKELVMMNASERYSYFMENYRNISSRVPLQYIASYLGIAQPSLSRLRRAK